TFLGSLHWIYMSITSSFRTILVINEQSLPPWPSSIRCCSCERASWAAGRFKPAASPASTARFTSLFAKSALKVASKLLFAAEESIMSGTGYHVCCAHDCPEEAEVMSQKTLASRPSSLEIGRASCRERV